MFTVVDTTNVVYIFQYVQVYFINYLEKHTFSFSLVMDGIKDCSFPIALVLEHVICNSWENNQSSQNRPSDYLNTAQSH